MRCVCAVRVHTCVSLGNYKVEVTIEIKRDEFLKHKRPPRPVLAHPLAGDDNAAAADDDVDDELVDDAALTAIVTERVRTV
jgi:hypothetical protein